MCQSFRIRPELEKVRHGVRVIVHHSEVQRGLALQYRSYSRRGGAVEEQFLFCFVCFLG